jgi:hypothetical protein
LGTGARGAPVVMMTPEGVRVRKGWLDRAGNGTALERFRVHLVRVSLEADRRDAELMHYMTHKHRSLTCQRCRAGAGVYVDASRDLVPIV